MAFNINAQVILSAPKNIQKVRQTISKGLSGISANIDLKVDPKSSAALRSINTELDAINQNLKQIQLAKVSLGNFRQFSSAVDKSSKSLNTIDKSAQLANQSLKQTQQQLSSTTAEVRNFGKEAALATRRFAAFTIVSGGIFGLFRSFKSGVRNAIDFEKQLIRISQVTGASSSGIKSLQGEIDGLSTSLGIAADELAEVALTLAQTGRTIPEIRSALNAIARSSLTPTFGSLKDTTEGVIAVLEQFNISASRTEEVLGSLNAVAKNFAVESADLISVIRRAGGVFAAAEPQFKAPEESLSELIALFTAVRSTTRESAETIATGLRTIFSRIQRPATIQFLRQFNIELLDAQGQFVGTFEAFKRISEGIEGLRISGDSVGLAKVVEELGGIRQAGKIIPLLQNFEKAERARQVALAGTASISSDVEKAQKSLGFAVDQLSQKFSKFIRDVVESKSFQTLSRVLIAIGDNLLTVANAFTPLLPLFTTIASIKISKSLLEFGKGFIGGFNKLGGAEGLGERIGGLGSVDTVGPSGDQKINKEIKEAGNRALISNTAALSQTDASLLTLNETMSSLIDASGVLVNSMKGLQETMASLVVSQGQTPGGILLPPTTGTSPLKPPKRRSMGGPADGQTLLKSGEAVISPENVKAMKLSNLRKMNQGISMVGGNSPIDNIPADLDDGSFVLNRRGAQGLMSGGMAKRTKADDLFDELDRSLANVLEIPNEWLPEDLRDRRVKKVAVSKILKKLDARDAAAAKRSGRGVSVKFDKDRNITESSPERLAAIESYRSQVEKRGDISEDDDFSLDYITPNNDKLYRSQMAFVKQLIRERILTEEDFEPEEFSMGGLAAKPASGYTPYKMGDIRRRRRRSTSEDGALTDQAKYYAMLRQKRFGRRFAGTDFEMEEFLEELKEKQQGLNEGGVAKFAGAFILNKTKPILRTKGEQGYTSFFDFSDVSNRIDSVELDSNFQKMIPDLKKRKFESLEKRESVTTKDLNDEKEKLERYKKYGGTPRQQAKSIEEIADYQKKLEDVKEAEELRKSFDFDEDPILSSIDNNEINYELGIGYPDSDTGKKFFEQSIEGFKNVIKNSSKVLNNNLGLGKLITTPDDNLLKGIGIFDVVGKVLEASLASISKQNTAGISERETAKSSQSTFDFPSGLGNLASNFGINDFANSPTDAKISYSPDSTASIEKKIKNFTQEKMTNLMKGDFAKIPSGDMDDKIFREARRDSKPMGLEGGGRAKSRYEDVLKRAKIKATEEDENTKIDDIIGLQEDTYDIGRDPPTELLTIKYDAQTGYTTNKKNTVEPDQVATLFKNDKSSADEWENIVQDSYGGTPTDPNYPVDIIIKENKFLDAKFREESSYNEYEARRKALQHRLVTKTNPKYEYLNPNDQALKLKNDEFVGKKLTTSSDFITDSGQIKFIYPKFKNIPLSGTGLQSFRTIFDDTESEFDRFRYDDEPTFSGTKDDLNNIKDYNPKQAMVGGSISTGEDLVSTILTPGELVFPPSEVQRAGLSNLMSFNKTGNPSFLNDFNSNNISMVPGTGNTDTFPKMLPSGSFVVKKRSSRAISDGSQKLRVGGVVGSPQRLQSGGAVGFNTSQMRFEDSMYKNLKSLSPLLAAIPGLTIGFTQLASLDFNKTSSFFNALAITGALMNNFGEAINEVSNKKKEEAAVVDKATSETSDSVDALATSAESASQAIDNLATSVVSPNVSKDNSQQQQTPQAPTDPNKERSSQLQELSKIDLQSPIEDLFTEINTKISSGEDVDLQQMVDNFSGLNWDQIPADVADVLKAKLLSSLTDFESKLRSATDSFGAGLFESTEAVDQLKTSIKSSLDIQELLSSAEVEPIDLSIPFGQIMDKVSDSIAQYPIPTNFNKEDKLTYLKSDELFEEFKNNIENLNFDSLPEELQGVLKQQFLDGLADVGTNVDEFGGGITTSVAHIQKMNETIAAFVNNLKNEQAKMAQSQMSQQVIPQVSSPVGGMGGRGDMKGGSPMGGGGLFSSVKNLMGGLDKGGTKLASFGKTLTTVGPKLLKIGSIAGAVTSALDPIVGLAKNAVLGEQDTTVGGVKGFRGDSGAKAATGGAIDGAMSVAGIGATIGSFFGPIGTAVGGIVGGIGGAIIGGIGGWFQQQKFNALDNLAQASKLAAENLQKLNVAIPEDSDKFTKNIQLVSETFKQSSKDLEGGTFSDFVNNFEFNMGDALMGAVAGAVTGAAIGVWGAGIGAIPGAITGAIAGFASGGVSGSLAEGLENATAQENSVRAIRNKSRGELLAASAIDPALIENGLQGTMDQVKNFTESLSENVLLSLKTIDEQGRAVSFDTIIQELQDIDGPVGESTAKLKAFQENFRNLSKMKALKQISEIDPDNKSKKAKAFREDFAAAASLSSAGKEADAFKLVTKNISSSLRSELSRLSISDFKDLDQKANPELQAKIFDDIAKSTGMSLTDVSAAFNAVKDASAEASDEAFAQMIAQQQLAAELKKSRKIFDAFATATSVLGKTMLNVASDFSFAVDMMSSKVDDIFSGDRSVSFDPIKNIFGDITGRSADELKAGFADIKAILLQGDSDTDLDKVIDDLPGVLSFSEQLPDLLTKTIRDFEAKGTDANVQEIVTAVTGGDDFKELPEAVRSAFEKSLRASLLGGASSEGGSGSQTINLAALKELVENDEIGASLNTLANSIQAAANDITSAGNELRSAFAKASNAFKKIADERIASELRVIGIQSDVGKAIASIRGETFDPSTTLNREVAALTGMTPDQITPEALLERRKQLQETLNEKQGQEPNLNNLSQNDAEELGKLTSDLQNLDTAINKLIDVNTRLASIQTKLEETTKATLSARDKQALLFKQITEAKTPQERAIALEEFNRPLIAAQKLAAGQNISDQEGLALAQLDPETARMFGIEPKALEDFKRTVSNMMGPRMQELLNETMPGLGDSVNPILGNIFRDADTDLNEERQKRTAEMIEVGQQAEELETGRRLQNEEAAKAAMQPLNNELDTLSQKLTEATERFKKLRAELDEFSNGGPEAGGGETDGGEAGGGATGGGTAAAAVEARTPYATSRPSLALPSSPQTLSDGTIDTGSLALPPVETIFPQSLSQPFPSLFDNNNLSEITPVPSSFNQDLIAQILSDSTLSSDTISGLSSPPPPTVSALRTLNPEDFISKLPTDSDTGSIGSQLVLGLSTGIASNSSNAVDAIQTLSENLIGTAVEIFEIKSPSKIFEEIGNNIIEGFILGITNRSEEVKSAISETLFPKDLGENLDVPNMFKKEIVKTEAKAPQERAIALEEFNRPLMAAQKLAAGQNIIDQEGLALAQLDTDTARMFGIEPDALENYQSTVSGMMNPRMEQYDPFALSENIEPTPQKKQAGLFSKLGGFSGKIVDGIMPRAIGDIIGEDTMQKRGRGIGGMLDKVAGAPSSFMRQMTTSRSKAASPIEPLAEENKGIEPTSQQQQAGLFSQLGGFSGKIVDGIMPRAIGDIIGDNAISEKGSRLGGGIDNFISRASPFKSSREGSLRETQAREKTNGVTISNEKMKGSLVQNQDEILLLPNQLTESFEVFGVITEKFINNLNPIVEQLDKTVNRLENLPTLQIQLDTKVGPVEVVLNGAALLKSFEESIQSKILSAIAEHFNSITPDIGGNPKNRELYSFPKMR
jgi:hypothetical protein